MTSRPELRWFAPDVYDAMGGDLSRIAEHDFGDHASQLERGNPSKSALSYTAAAWGAMARALNSHAAGDPLSSETPFLPLAVGAAVAGASTFLDGWLRWVLGGVGGLLCFYALAVGLRHTNRMYRLSKRLNDRFVLGSLSVAGSKATQAKLMELERERGLPTANGWGDSQA